MFIEKVEVERFRSIKDEGVELGSFTTFVGRNGVGKSTLLYALDTFYNVAAQYTMFDYFNHQQINNSIKIRVTYGRLREDELAEFGAYVHKGKLVVTKTINQGGARYYGSISQIPEFAELRKLGANDKRNGLKHLVEADKLPQFPDIPRKGEEVDQVMTDYEAAHPELTKPLERETQFFGPRNVGGGKLDKYTKFVLVPAVKDAASEMERRGAIIQLLDLIVSRSIANRRDFQEFKKDFEAKVKELYGKDNLPELAELGRLITRRLVRYAPGAELLIDFEELKPPQIPLPAAVVSLSEDNFSTPISYSGHGLQRALVLALLEQLSLTPIPPLTSIEPDDGLQKVVRQPDLILAIEEPELYLHPARSRYLSTILRDLSKAEPAKDTPGTQVICVSHSPYFVEVEHFDDIRMCRKITTGAVDEPRATKIVSFSRSQAALRLADIHERDPKNFTADSFVVHSVPVLNSLVNEGLFADVAVVVEGSSDVAALWTLQEMMGKKWAELGVVVVPVVGKTNIDRAVVTFEGFGIPTFFMFDGDKSQGQTAKTNNALLRLRKQSAVDFPVTTVDIDYAVFEEDIETYLKQAAGTRFIQLRDSCAQNCGHERPSESLKNAEVMAMFIRECYQQQVTLSSLSEIVENISTMARSQLGK